MNNQLNNHQVIILTQKGRMYRSSDGGLTWTDITDQLAQLDRQGTTATVDSSQPPIFERVEVSPANKDVFWAVIDWCLRHGK